MRASAQARRRQTSWRRAWAAIIRTASRRATAARKKTVANKRKPPRLIFDAAQNTSRAHCSSSERASEGVRTSASQRAHRAALCDERAPISSRTRVPAAGSRKFSVPTATQRAPAAMKSSASRPALDAAHPHHRQLGVRRDRRGHRERDRRARQDPDRPPAAGAEPRTSRCRDRRPTARRVLIREIASAPPSCAAARDRRRRPRRSASASRSAAWR